MLDFSGMCEASAAALVAPGTIVVANDEDNVLRIFATAGGAPLVEDDTVLSALGVPTQSGSDIEAAARIGDRIYWITSHSLTKKGKEKSERSVIFATDIDTKSPVPSLRKVELIYRGLRNLLVTSKVLSRWDLADAAARSPESGLRAEAIGSPTLQISRLEATRRAEGGLNIEGLADRRDGGLLVGLRSPVRAKQALIFTLKNPGQLDGGRDAILAEPMEVDLGGFGIRSIERIAGTDDYEISAGPVSGGAPFRLYRWRFGERSARLLQPPPTTLAAEAVVLPLEQSGRALLLSDDGDYPKEDACGSPPKHFRGHSQSLSEVSGRMRTAIPGATP